jgi:hypothetical protein
MLSIKAEGVLLDLPLQARRAEAGEAFDLLEAQDKLTEAPPAGFGRAVGMMGESAGVEDALAPEEASDLAGAQVDQEIELAVRIEEGGGEARAGGPVPAQLVAGLFVGEESEATMDDVAQIRLHRRSRTVAPENPEDDLPERFHAGDYTLARNPAESGELYPTSLRASALRSGGKFFGRPTNLQPLHPTVRVLQGAS